MPVNKNGIAVWVSMLTTASTALIARRDDPGLSS